MNVTTQMTNDYFNGALAQPESEAVKKLLNSIIASLLKKGEVLVDAIADTLRTEHNIEVSEDCLADYFTAYAQENLPNLFND